MESFMAPARDALPETSPAPTPPTTAGAISPDPEETVATAAPASSPTLTVAAEETEPEVGIPSHVGRYCVRALLGQGGFGRVYLVYDEHLERQVTVKVPHRRFVLDSEAAASYLAEARAAAHLDHPNIVPVYDAGSTADFPCFIVTKYIEGATLD